MNRAKLLIVVCGLATCWLNLQQISLGQTFELNSITTSCPPSGGMGGASVSRPQDLQSAIAGNPSTLRQFKGTHFPYGGAWQNVDYSITQNSNYQFLE